MKTIYLKKWSPSGLNFVLVRVSFPENDAYYNGEAEMYDVDTREWEKIDWIPDYTSGFGDSDMWDKITEEEAEAAIREYHEKHSEE